MLRWRAGLGDVTATSAEISGEATPNTVFYTYTIFGTHKGTQGVYHGYSNMENVERI